MGRSVNKKKDDGKPLATKSWWSQDGPYLGLLLVASSLLRWPRLTESLWYDEVCYTSVFFDSAR
jgi:hypothetical protein